METGKQGIYKVPFHLREFRSCVLTPKSETFVRDVCTCLLIRCLLKYFNKEQNWDKWC